MRAVVLVGGLALMVVVGLVALLRGDAERVPRAVSKSAVSREGDATLVAANDAERRSLDASGTKDASSVTSSRSLDDLAAFGAQLALCCETEDGDIVPGAELWIADPGHDGWLLESLSDDPAGWVETHGVRALADERGVALVARPSSAVAILARAHGLVALLTLDPSEASPFHVVLHASAALTIVVRDTSAAPVADAGVRVLLADSSQTLWKGRTDAQGRAHVGAVAGPEVTVPLRVVADVVMLDAPVGWWLRAAGAERTVELVVARSRRLAIAFVDARRRAISFDAVAHVSLERSPAAGLADGSFPRELDVEIERGLARIDCDAEMKELELELSDLDGDWTLELPPPGAGATRIELAFEAEDRAPRLVELRDETGGPVAGVKLDLLQLAQLAPETWKTEDSTSATSDELGRVTFLRWPRGDPGVAQRLVVLDAHARPPRWAQIELSTETDASDAPLPGILSALPIAMAGRVRDVEGHPIAGARVCFEFPDEAQRPWFARKLEVARTDADGRFVLRAPPAPVRARARLERAQESLSLESGDGPLRWGDLDLDLRVEAYGSVDLTLAGLHDASAIELALSNEENDCSRFESWREGDDVHARMRDVPAGKYAFAVLAPGASRPLAEVNDVVVRAGEATRDPRLLPVVSNTGAWPQASVRVSNVVLHVVDAHGDPIEHGWYTNAGPEHDRAWPWACGEIHLGAEPQGTRIAVWAPGCDRCIDRTPETSTTWTLPPLTPLRLSLVVPAAWKEAGLRVLATVHPWSDRVVQAMVSRSLSCEVVAGAKLEFAVPSGTYRATIEARWRDVAGAHQTLELSTADIEHRGAEHPQPWSLPGDARRWELTLRARGAPLDPERR